MAMRSRVGWLSQGELVHGAMLRLVSEDCRGRRRKGAEGQFAKHLRGEWSTKTRTRLGDVMDDAQRRGRRAYMSQLVLELHF
jgi:hypothetical protein